MTHTHTPDPTFLRDLEREILGAARRRAALGPPTPRRAWRRFRVGLLLVAGGLLGACAVVAVERVGLAREASLHRLRAEIQWERADRLARDARADAEQAEAQFRAALVGERRLLEIRMALKKAEKDRALRRLDLEEVRITGRPPRRELFAPVLDGRDLVGERLRLEHEFAQAELGAARKSRERAAQLAQAGALTAEESAAAALEADVALASERQLAERVDLRQAFLEGGIPAARVELLGTRSEALAARGVAERRLAAARDRRKRIEALAEAGLASREELRAAERDVGLFSDEVRLAAAEVDWIEERLARR